MRKRISKGTRQELLAAIGKGYRAAGRGEKRVILGEFPAVTGYHGKHAVRLRNTPMRAKPDEGDEKGRRFVGTQRGHGLDLELFDFIERQPS